MKIVCPHCHFMQFGNEKLIGKQIRCKKCHEVFSVTDTPQPAGSYTNTEKRADNESYVNDKPQSVQKKGGYTKVSPLDTLRENKAWSMIKMAIFFLLPILFSLLVLGPVWSVFLFIFIGLDFFFFRKFRRAIARAGIRIAYWIVILFVVYICPLVLSTFGEFLVEAVADMALVERVKNHPSDIVRLSAIANLDNPQALLQIARHESDQTHELEQRNLSHLSEREKAIFLASYYEVLEKETRLRILAVHKLADQVLLAEIARDTEIPPLVRTVAMMKLTNQTVLAEAVMANDEIIKTSALINCIDRRVLEEIANNDNDEEYRIIAKTKLELQNRSQLDLYAFFIHEKDEGRRLTALTLIHDQDLLTDILLSTSDVNIQGMIIVKITNQELLAKIVREGTNEMRAIALLNLSDQASLEELARTSDNVAIRLVAATKLKNQFIGQSIIEDFAKKGIPGQSAVRLTAIYLLKNEALLNEIGKNTFDEEIREAVKWRLDEL